MREGEEDKRISCDLGSYIITFTTIYYNIYDVREREKERGSLENPPSCCAHFLNAKVEIHLRAKYNSEDILWSFPILKNEQPNPHGYMY